MDYRTDAGRRPITFGTDIWGAAGVSEQDDSADRNGVLDSITYQVAETIIYDMIHNRHKHRREEHLIKQRSISFQDTQIEENTWIAKEMT